MFARSSKTRITHSRPSFTLVELLVVIAIIGIMAGMVLFTLASAQQDALRNRTRGTIDKINQVILERWEGYRYRSVKLPVPPEALQKKWITARQIAGLRSLFLKDMMRMEMPDSYVDLAYTPTSLDLTLKDGAGNPFVQNFKSAPGREYNVLRNYFSNPNPKLRRSPLPPLPPSVMRPIVEVDLPATIIPNSKPSPHWTDSHQSAECLYAIVAHSTIGGGSALEGFVASEIGDVDGDGFPEFIDAWGEPIVWIRWPAGYESALNLSYKLSLPPTDAFDPLRTAGEWDNPPRNPPRQQPWTVVPLIVSAGSDREFGIDHPDNIVFATLQSVFAGGTTTPTVGLISNADQASDNITNHDLLLE